MASILMYGACMILGCVLGLKGILKDKIFPRLGIIQEILLLLLIFVMGVGIGKNKEIMADLFSLGVKAFVIALFTIVFSVILVHIYVKMFKKNKQNKEIKNDN